MFTIISALSNEQIQFIGWTIAALSTLLTVYFARKSKPIEKLTLELNVIHTRNELLENRISDLETKEDAHRNKIDDLNTERSNLHIKVDVLNKEIETLKEKLIADQVLIDSQKAHLMDMQTQVINSQVSASLMRNQVSMIAKKFGIADSVVHLKQDNNAIE